MKPRKRFGQNFLRDPQVIDQIVKAINPQPEKNLIEIGPGEGALTTQVLPLCKRLTVIELDRDLVQPLQQRCQSLGELIIHQADILKFDITTLRTDERLLDIFGNLPYNISSPLLFHLLDFSSHINSMCFMLQKEVVDRMAAAPGNKAYGRLSVMIQYRCEVEPLFTVPPSAFYPPPKVNSAIVRLLPLQTLPYPAKDIDCLQTVVRTAFGQRRKTLANALQRLVTAEQWLDLQIDPSRRPDQISLEEYVNIANFLYNKAHNDHTAGRW